jgi:hypothetical protein
MFGHTPDGAGSDIVTLPDDRLRERRPVIDVEGETDDADRQRQSDAELLSLARKRFQTSAQAEAAVRQEMYQDLKFRSGDQWPDSIRTDRVNDKRPILTINRIPQFVKQITNPERQARPAIQVNPVGDGADKDTAEVIQGLMRHIETTSHAEVAYDEAYEDAVVMGRGWFRIMTDYVDDGTFEQEVIVKRVQNPFTIYVDPSAQELDYSDARYMFVIEDVPKDEYEETYPKASMASLELFQSVGDHQSDWFPEGKIRIAEYWFVELKTRKIAQIHGSPNPNDPRQVQPILTVPLEHVPEGVQVLATREVSERVVHWVKMNATEVLERSIWPGKWIPIVPMLGDEIDLNGKKDYVGIVRYARDPQRMYNFWCSSQTEMIALAPKAPFIGAEGQFKGYEAQWKIANTRNLAYLEYVPKELGGQPVPPPQRQVAEPPIRAVGEALKQADNDMKAVIGFYDASLGKQGPEESGKAILARQKQGETANINFIDNFGRALWHAGRIYLDLIQKVYTTARVIHIMGADEKRSQIGINMDWIVNGVTKFHDVTLGRYNISLSIGPTYQSRRQEAVASMLKLVEADPQILPIIGDLLVGEMDWPMAKQIASRLKKMLPPPLQDMDGQQPQIPPQAAAQITALQQQMQLVTQKYGEVVQLLKTKKLETDSKERIAIINAQAQLAMAAAKMGSERDKNIFDAEFAKFQQMIDHIHEHVLSDTQHEDALELAALPPPTPPAAPPAPTGGGQGQ